MISQQQAAGPSIRACSQAAIREAGEQGPCGSLKLLSSRVGGPTVFLGAIPMKADEFTVKVNSYGPGRPLSLV